MSDIPIFEPTRQAALAQLAKVNPANYAKSRNFIGGAVTYLSPWLTHGFIDTKEAAKSLHDRRPLNFEDKLIFEFGWREFFKHAHAHLGDGILSEVRRPPYSGKYETELPDDIRQGRTGVRPIDEGVATLYATGYIHNHMRMWIASYVVHIRKVSWRAGADWMYGHLLDGDLASNHLSWQWVAATFSHKPYVFNAENVAKYAPDLTCWDTVVDTDYPTLADYAQSKTAFGPERNAPRIGVDEPPFFHLFGIKDNNITVSEHGEGFDDMVPYTKGHGEKLNSGRIFDVRDRAALNQRLANSSNGKIELVHPWMLNESYLSPRGATSRFGVLIADFHEKFPWNRRRWEFVLGAMRTLVDEIWLMDSKQWSTIASRAKDGQMTIRSMECLNPGYAEFLGQCGAEIRLVPTILPSQNMFQKSFSRFYNKGCATAVSLDNALTNGLERARKIA